MAAQPDWTRVVRDQSRDMERVQEYVDRVRGDAVETRAELRRVYEAYASTQYRAMRRA
jgi:asparagine synthetase A